MWHHQRLIDKRKRNVNTAKPNNRHWSVPRKIHPHHIPISFPACQEMYHQNYVCIYFSPLQAHVKSTCSRIHSTVLVRSGAFNLTNPQLTITTACKISTSTNLTLRFQNKIHIHHKAGRECTQNPQDMKYRARLQDTENHPCSCLQVHNCTRSAGRIMALCGIHGDRSPRIEFGPTPIECNGLSSFGFL